MKQLAAILLLIGALPLVSCTQEDEVLPAQQQKIVSYLTGTHTPRLISEAEKDASLDVNPPYYSISGDAAYRYIADVYNPERLKKTLAEAGDQVSITFRMYVFGFNNIAATEMPFFSNDLSLKEAYEKAGLTSLAWIFEPLTVTLGAGEILKGLEGALVGCRQADLVEVYMSYNMAYGDVNFGIIPRQSPIAVYLTVDKVVKK